MLEKGKDHIVNMFFVLCLTILLAFPVLLQAQDYGNQDTTKVDSSDMNNRSRTDTTYMKQDTTGYLFENNNDKLAYNNSSNFFVGDSTTTDTSGTDTSGMDRDTMSYIGETGISSLAYNGNNLNSVFIQDSAKTDSSEINDENNNNGIYRDSTGSNQDTMGYNNSGNFNNSYSSNSDNYSTSNNKTDQTIEINPVQDLSQNLKDKVNLNEDQTSQVKSILREYEADTYNARGNREEAQEAANDAQQNIADVLTDRQKTDWNSTKNDWWASVEKQLDLSNLNSNSNNFNSDNSSSGNM